VSADLHIHVFADGELTEEDFKVFFGHTLGSKWFDFDGCTREEENAAWHKISDTPNVWVGSVSWLKAALFEDSDQYVPSGVAQVSDVIGEDWPIVDDALIEAISKALASDNKTAYAVTEPGSVVDFLKQHKGKRAFTVSW
jgi:hypothetical protein